MPRHSHTHHERALVFSLSERVLSCPHHCTLAGACKLAAAILGIDLLALKAGKIFLPDFVDAEYLLKKVEGEDDAMVAMHGPDDTDVTVSAKLQKMALRLCDGGDYYILRFRHSTASVERDTVRKTIAVGSTALPAPVSTTGSSAEEHHQHTQLHAGSTLRHRVAPLTATLTTTTTSMRWSRASDPDTSSARTSARGSTTAGGQEDGSCHDLLFGGTVEEQSPQVTRAQVHRGRAATPRRSVVVTDDASSARSDDTPEGGDILAIPDAPVLTSTAWQKPVDKGSKSIKFHAVQRALPGKASSVGGSRDGGIAPGSVYSKSSSHQSNKSSSASEVLRRTISAASAKLEPSLTLLVRAFFMLTLAANFVDISMHVRSPNDYYRRILIHINAAL